MRVVDGSVGVASTEHVTADSLIGLIKRVSRILRAMQHDTYQERITEHVDMDPEVLDLLHRGRVLVGRIQKARLIVIDLQPFLHDCQHPFLLFSISHSHQYVPDRVLDTNEILLARALPLSNQGIVVFSSTTIHK
jgi:hypothetical protein